MEDQKEKVYKNILISSLSKEYDLDFNEFKNRWNLILKSENTLNQNGIILILNTLDSLKNTMDPLSYEPRTKMKMNTRKIVSDSLEELNKELIIYPKNTTEILKILFIQTIYPSD